MATHSLEQYLEASKRENTQRSYASAIRHFEISWGGMLPATTQSVANYLVAYATSLSINTLRLRLAALAHWHHENGFPDPTAAAVVKKTLKGIQTLHPAQEKQAEPLQLTQLSSISAWLGSSIAAADHRGDHAEALRLRRDRAMMLLGFWRGFRTDELIRLETKNVKVVPDQGMTCFLARTKGDRQLSGKTYRVPALSQWCAVTATLDWIAAAKLTNGPLFRGINQWGDLASTSLHPNSVIPMLRRLFQRAGIPTPEAYSGHSLRRGFAGWANTNGWEVKALMEYVGWKDVQSAMRYIDAPDAFGQQRIEAALATLPIAAGMGAKPIPPLPLIAPPATVALILILRLTPRRKGRSVAKARKTIETVCLSPHQAIVLNDERSRYRLTIQADDDLVLDEIASSLIEDIYRIADNHDNQLDASLHDEAGERHWD